MNIFEVRAAIESIKYKPGSFIDLAPVEGRISNPEAGALKLIIKLTLVDAHDQQSICVKVHYKEIPPAHHIRDKMDLLRHVRNALRDCEQYESDQWLALGEIYPFRRPNKSIRDIANIS